MKGMQSLAFGQMIVDMVKTQTGFKDTQFQVKFEFIDKFLPFWMI